MTNPTVGDITARLRFYYSDDPLDFKKTGKGVVIIEDGVADVPLPAGPPGPPGRLADSDRLAVRRAVASVEQLEEASEAVMKAWTEAKDFAIDAESAASSASSSASTASSARDAAVAARNRAIVAEEEAGKDAYTLAVENGFTGSVAEWLTSLKGEIGAPMAWDDLTEEQKQSLQGEQGDEGPQGDLPVVVSTVPPEDTDVIWVNPNDVLPGQPDDTPWNLSGTGFPEGVVAAPVGAVYTDTEATAGAIKWIKTTGTEATGWKVQYGDTGLRDIASLVEHNREGQILLRRVGHEATMTFLRFHPGETLGQWGKLMALPDDWRPAMDDIRPFPVNNTSAAQDVLWQNYRSGQLRISNHMDVTAVWNSSITWVPRSPWVASLPGTPA